MNIFFKVPVSIATFIGGTIAGACKGVGFTALALTETVGHTLTGGVANVMETMNSGENKAVKVFKMPFDFLSGTIKGAGKGLEKTCFAIGNTVFYTFTDGYMMTCNLLSEEHIDIEKIKKLIEEGKKANLKELKFQVKKDLSQRLKLGLELNKLNCGFAIENNNDGTETVIITY